MTRRGLNKSVPSRFLPAKKLVRVDHVHAPADYQVAIDFGTTFTTIAFSRRRGDGATSDILTIEEFPGDRCVSRNGTQVPTEIWYSSYKKEIDAKHNPIEPNVLCGYEVVRCLELPEDDELRLAYEDSGLIRMPKLLLGEDSYVKGLKDGLLEGLKKLKEGQLIKKNEDVIEHLLVYFLKHTKSILERDHAFNNSSTVQMTLAVPVCWTAQANASMTMCVQNAMMTAQFGSDGRSVPQLFIVNEAEAAAMNAIDSKNSHFIRSEAFILLDVGGGTTDLGTYTIAHDKPLRLNEEVSHPIGAVCGSSDLNVRMHKFAAINLANETYLEDAAEGITINSLIESEILPHFESVVKRAYDPNKEESFSFRLHGLRTSPFNGRIRKNRFLLKSEDLRRIFQKSLETIEKLLLNQIEHAQRNNTSVDKVVLVGGFGDSPALKAYLKARLQRLNQQKGTSITLVHAPANTSATGVATGAITRAQNKNHGPKRIPCRSIGVIRHVEDNPDVYSREVLKQRWSISDHDGMEYIRRTIRWVIKAGVGEIKPSHHFEFDSMHCFGPDQMFWAAVEELYASDTCTEDYFTRDHPKNRGKTTKIGQVEFDLTHLQGSIDLHRPSDVDDGIERYEVTLRIRITVIDRNMEFVAYWPADDQDAIPIRGRQTPFDLSATFKPGTA